MKWLRLNVKLSKGFKVFLIGMAVLLLVPAMDRLTGVDDKLKPYVDEIARLSNGRLVIEHARLSRIPTKYVLGHCLSHYNVIHINQDLFWKKTYREKMLLLMHEGFHCEKGRDHDTTVKGFCPESIMYPTSSGRWCAEMYWDKYIEELRTWE